MPTVGSACPRQIGAANAATIATNRRSSSRFASRVVSPASPAVTPSAIASLAPLGVSQLSSQQRSPSSVRKMSARAMPCQAGAESAHMNRWASVKPKKPASSAGSAATILASSS